MTLSCIVLRTVYKFCPSSSTIWRVFNQRFNEFFDQRFHKLFWSTIWRVFYKRFCEISKYYSGHSASLCPEKLFGIHIFRGQVPSFWTTTIWQVFYINDSTRFLINDFTNFWPVCAQCKFCPSSFVEKLFDIHCFSRSSS